MTHALSEDNRALVQRVPPIPSLTDVWGLENILDSRSPTTVTPTQSELPSPPDTPLTPEATRAAEQEDYLSDAKTHVSTYLSSSVSPCVKPSVEFGTMSHVL